MNAVDYMKNKIDIEVLLKFYGITKIQRHGQNIRCACPIHKGDNPTAFVFKKKNNLWYCHTGCKTGGDVYDLVMMMENVEFPLAVRRIAEIFNIDISNMEIGQRTKDSITETKEWIEQMLSMFSKSELTEYNISQLGDLFPINKYRQYTKETLEHFNVQYCDKAIIKTATSEIYINKRIVVPIYYQKVLVGITMRKTLSNEKIKWLHQPSDIQTGNYLYNIDNIEPNITNQVILTEGCPDTWTVHQCGYKNVVGLFGAHMTEQQEKILLTKTYNVIIALDTDFAGIKGAIDIYNKLKYKMNILFADIPLEYDIGELDAHQVAQILDNPIAYKEWSQKEYVMDILKNNFSMFQWNQKYKEVIIP